MSDKINVIGDVSGDNIRISQIFAPGAPVLAPEVFVSSNDAVPFSVQWLLFSQQSIPLIGRHEERHAMLRFLDDPRPFAWWAVTGSGGYGKSRFALDFLRHLPGGWEGGFLPRHNFSARDTAAWQPRGNMLWIIDDAASAGRELSRIIGNWATLNNDGPYKLRLLLLERGHSAEAGWWAELTQELSPQAASINHTLFQPPLALAPLGALSDDFLTALRGQIGAADNARLETALAALGEEKILEQSQGGNPLLLMLLSAELLSDNTGAGTGVDSTTLAERYFTRELDLLKDRCDAAQLRFGVMLDLLFLTTSCYPIRLLLDHDTLIPQAGNGIVVVTDAKGKRRLPTVVEARRLGIDVDALRRPMLNTLNSALQIDDVEAYLSLLDETGLAARRYAIQPDLIAAVLFNLVFNSFETSTNLKRRRGEFSAHRLLRLISSAAQISSAAPGDMPVSAWSAWARLDDRALNGLIGYLRELGQTIRWPMLMLRELNLHRNSKVPLDVDRLFAPSNTHPNAPEVGHYFTDLRDAIARDPFDDATIAALADSPHCWSAPYVDWLLELTGIEQLRLALAICTISDVAILDRLTNLSNFMRCIQGALVGASARCRDGTISEAENVVLDRLIGSLYDFATTRVWPALMRVDDRSFKDGYVILARVLTTSSFFVANGLRGHDESPETRHQALLGLELARLALAIAPSPGDLQYVDRNAALLRAHGVGEPLAVAELYRQLLDTMQPYADPKAYTGAIEDLLIVAGLTTHTLDTLFSILDSAPPKLVLCERLISRVIDALIAIVQPDLSLVAEPDLAQAARLTPRFLRYFADHMRETEDAEAADGITQLALIMANLAATTELEEEAARLLADVHASLEEKPPSAVFLRALLKGATAVQHVFHGRASPCTALVPFGIQFLSYTKADLEHLVIDDAERDRLGELKGLVFATSSYPLNGESFVLTSIIVDLVEGADPNDAADAQMFGQKLSERLMNRTSSKGV